MFLAPDAFIKNDYKSAAFLVNPFYKHARALRDELYLRHFGHDREMFWTFALLFETKVQRTKVASHSIMSLFNSTIHPFN